MAAMNAKPISENSADLEGTLAEVESDLERLEQLDPAETPELANQISDQLTSVLDATEGPAN